MAEDRRALGLGVVAADPLEDAGPVVEPVREHVHVGLVPGDDNFCLAGSSVFVHDKQRCYRLDAATGRKLGEFPCRPRRWPARPWGYIACDGKLLFGSLANPSHASATPTCGPT